eukprot:6300983-Lingulodinium_polyedra.AAC.1
MRPALARASWTPVNSTQLAESWRARKVTVPGCVRRGQDRPQWAGAPRRRRVAQAPVGLGGRGAARRRPSVLAWPVLCPRRRGR